MQLRPAGNFKRWPKGREILCSKGNSNGKNEVSWHPKLWCGSDWFHKNLLQLKQAQWLPICLVSALSVHPRPRLSLRSALPHFTAGAGGGQGSPQEASRPGSPRVALLALAGAKLCEVCLSISFLLGPSHYVPCGLKLPWVLFGLERRFH